MDDPVSQMLVNEMCECTDKAEENRIKMSQAGKIGMKTRYDPNNVITELQGTYNLLITGLQGGYNYTNTKNNTDTKTAILPVSPYGETGLPEKFSDPPGNEPQKVPKAVSEIRDMLTAGDHPPAPQPALPFPSI
ncbi:MAG: hypothetical protein K6G68_02455 [Oscillospiraceae bacterium]|nr:hypothetical protein [Oscillospiraceae bacterium]